VVEKCEQALVDAAKGGDEAAFRALVEPLSRELSAYAYRMVGGYQDAEDALQETRLKAWRHLGSYDPTASLPVTSGGGDPAHSALGDCIRNAEEGGSYAWGPGNGGGAYQFAESTWEHYGGAASEFGVAGPAYQDQIFDNAINAGGASNWTDYDGC